MITTITREYCDKSYLIRLLQHYNKDYELLDYEIIGTNYDNKLTKYDLMSCGELIQEIILQAPTTISYTIELVQKHNKKNKRKNITKAIRRAIYTRDHGKCQCCGKPLTLGNVDCTIDHKIPHHKGGSNDPQNLQLLCRDCNLRKANRIISNKELYKEILENVQNSNK